MEDKLVTLDVALDQIKIHNLKTQSRQRKYVYMRHYMANYLVNVLGLTLTKTGELLGNRGHATVINSIANHKDLMQDFNKAYYYDYINELVNVMPIDNLKKEDPKLMKQEGLVQVSLNQEQLKKLRMIMIDLDMHTHNATIKDLIERYDFSK